jgi:FkbM family methyltransferase
MSHYTFNQVNQSPWIVDIYNQFLDYKNNGFIVEIGVGHTLKNVDNIIPIYGENYERCGSNSADLIDLGWNAIFIEPVKEYCDEVEISHKNNLDRIKIVNLAASDISEELHLSLGDTLSKTETSSNRYDWIGRKIYSKKTTEILLDNNCPKEIDIMSIDVEGFEHKVLQGLDFDIHTPKILIVETNIINSTEIEKLLPSTYKKIKEDSLNTAWVNNA